MSSGRLPDQALFELLQTYHEYREGNGGSSLGRIQDCEPQNMTPREPERLLLCAEVGSALQRLSKRQRWAVLRWYWDVSAYVLAENLRHRNNVFLIELSKQPRSKKRQEALFDLASDYQGFALKDLDMLVKTNTFKEGIELFSDQARRIIGAYRRRYY